MVGAVRNSMISVLISLLSVTSDTFMVPRHAYATFLSRLLESVVVGPGRFRHAVRWASGRR